MNESQHRLLMLPGCIGLVLVVATVIGQVLARRVQGEPSPVIDNLNARINAWWVMVFAAMAGFHLTGTQALSLAHGSQ